MLAPSDEIYREVDPAKKDAVWANRVIGYIRMSWWPVVSSERVSTNKAYLYGTQSMASVEGSFKDKEFKAKHSFEPIGSYEAIRQSLIEEITSSPPKSALKAIDPSAVSEREDDIKLLRNRSILEKDISRAQNQVGLPKYKVDYKNFNGNVEEFDKMGLDENDPDDINFFSKDFHRLHYEIAGQSAINNVMALNKFDKDTVRRLVDDILSVKFICFETYVDKITGEIKQEHLDLEICKGLLGTHADGRSDMARGWEESITVMEWLQRVGNEFDWEKDWHRILFAINHAGGLKHTGFNRNGRVYNAQIELAVTNIDYIKPEGFSHWESNIVSWNEAVRMQVSCGKIEWLTCEATSTAIKSREDNFIEFVPYSQELEKMQEVKGYFKESVYQQVWYSSYYLSSAVDRQWIYGWGRVYYQSFTGANDEYSSGTIKFIREPGQSGVEITKKDVDLANLVYWKLRFLVWKAKPKPDTYVWEELVQQAKMYMAAFPDSVKGNKANALDSIIENIIQQQQSSSIHIRSFPMIDGKTIGQIPSLDAIGTREGVDPLAMFMQSCLVFAESRIEQKIGWNGMRSGMNPPSRESAASEKASVVSSQLTTNYVYRMIQGLKENAAITITSYCQDIIQFKDTVPYKWLKQILGTDQFEALKVLEKFAAHRFGIFIEDYNTQLDRQELKQNASIALAKGIITFDQWFMITQTDDPTRANQILSHLSRKKEKQARKQQIEDQQRLHNNQIAQTDKLIELENVRGKWGVDRSNIDKDAAMYVANKGYDAKVDVKNITVDAEPEKQAAKAEAAKEIADKKQSVKQSQPFPQ